MLSFLFFISCGFKVVPECIFIRFRRTIVESVQIERFCDGLTIIMKRFHACCPSRATNHIANLLFRSLALGSGVFSWLLIKIHGNCAVSLQVSHDWYQELSKCLSWDHSWSSWLCRTWFPTSFNIVIHYFVVWQLSRLNLFGHSKII